MTTCVDVQSRRWRPGPQGQFPQMVLSAVALLCSEPLMLRNEERPNAMPRSQTIPLVKP